jgi:cell division transport system permease protein
MIIFYIKEVLKSIRSAKTSFILSLISTAIAVTLIMASFLIYSSSKELKNKISKNLIINVFLQDSIKTSDFDLLKYKIKNSPAVFSVYYISKEAAAENFIKETGEDFKKILDYNPLPASFSIILKEEYLQDNQYMKFTESLKKLPGVEDVVYQSELMNKVAASLNSFNNYIIILTVVLLFVSIYVVYSTIRLILNLKMEEIETMKLVGAKLITIKLPIVMNGVLIGLLAGLMSYLCFIGIGAILKDDFFIISADLITKWQNMMMLFSIGPVLGLLVSLFTLKKIKLKV